MKSKVCKKCQKEKLLTEFSKQKDGRFGVTSVCKECKRSPKSKERYNRLSLFPKGFKICSECDEIKHPSQFTKNRCNKDGLSCICRDCKQQKEKDYFKTNKNKFSKRAKNHYQKYKKKILKRVKKYRQKHSKIISKKSKVYYLIHKDLFKKRSSLYYKKNKGEIKRRVSKYSLENRDKINKHTKERLKNDLNFWLRTSVSHKTYKLLKGQSKSKSSLTLLGCSVAYLREHLEAQFKPGMNWDNYGFYGWHIDHIYPRSSFNLKKYSEQKICCHWSNLQPLWAKENWEKGATI
jgi:hypothetical protein